MSFDLTAKNIEARLEVPAQSVREVAFRTILKNRTYHGGILAPGSSLIKYGENRKGIRSRWYPETLKKRILKAATLRDRIAVVVGDGIEVIENNSVQTDCIFFIDPPYTASGKRAGSRLYTHFDLDHEKLFEVTSQVKGDFLMTYDDAQEVKELASKHGFDTRNVAMKNTHHAKMMELLIGRDLRWV